MFSYYYTKLRLFLFKHRSLFAVALSLAFYFFFNSLNDIAFCAEPDPCEQAYKESLKDAQQQKAANNWGQRTINNILLDGKTGKFGTATVEKDGRVYVNQLFEYTDNDDKTLRRMSDCVSAAKKK